MFLNNFNYLFTRSRVVSKLYSAKLSGICYLVCFTVCIELEWGKTDVKNKTMLLKNTNYICNIIYIYTSKYNATFNTAVHINNLHRLQFTSY